MVRFFIRQIPSSFDVRCKLHRNSGYFFGGFR